jgi:hypothetical protein
MTKQEVIKELRKLHEFHKIRAEGASVGGQAKGAEYGFRQALSLVEQIDEPPTEPCEFCSPGGEIYFLCVDVLSEAYDYTPTYCPDCGRKL